MLEIDLAVPCGLIVNELVTNALKHAFRDRESGEINIQLNEKPDRQIQLSVSDNGSGISKEIDILKQTTLGLQLVNALVGQIDGQMQYENERGSRFTILFAN